PAEQRGVVDEDVDVAELVDHAPDVAGDLLLVGHVAGHRDGRPAVALDPLDRALGRRRVDVVARDLRTVAGQRQRDAAADVRARPGDQGDLALQRDLHVPPLLTVPAGRALSETGCERRGRAALPPAARRAGDRGALQ